MIALASPAGQVVARLNRSSRQADSFLCRIPFVGPVLRALVPGEAATANPPWQTTAEF